MSKKHKIVAYRLDGYAEGMRISSLTESPRGTKVLAGSVQVNMRGKNKEEQTQALELAFRALQDVE